jgi:uncharacterized protein
MSSEPIDPREIFTCQKCGDCCKGFGGTYVGPEDISVISKFLGMDEERFVRECCQMSGSRQVIAVGENGYCVFWDRLCTIHPVKPRMCRAWPFIASVLIDVGNWRIMAGSCPGMRTDVEDDVILDEVRRALENG